MRENVSERIQRLYKEKTISEKGLKKALDVGLITEEVYLALVGGYYEKNASLKPEKVSEEGSGDE